MKKNKMESKSNKKISVIWEKIKYFFNHPAPLFIAFIAIICFLLVYIYKNNYNSTIYVGGINDSDLVVPSIHYFANNDMNFFYASTAIYDGKEKDTKIYNYELGYYVEDEDEEYVAFLTRSGKLTEKAKVSDIISEKSTWEFGEPTSTPNYFKSSVKSKLDKLHFIFKGSTKKDSDEADIFIDIPVKTEKITK